ncbi:MAG TPA: chromosome segregation protein SMC [Clostridia bacterium]|nr:chromosome segregation protein SMC [Clostridia bacterium]
MYLKRLEIFGFKSFAEKTEIQFSDGISAIVGPNGSGKSNISDAICWVMGEQSIKNLRGSKLEDVIFAGSEKRKPLGYAQVSLVLDNSDGYLPLSYSEVVITRKFYRSGESQFLINNNECRLKDIQELMLDTGLGKEAYSIISQGKVDEILNSSPEQRRLIFEEAAGIIKYKLRQKEAVKKLADAEQNLLRLADLIQEIKTQLPNLEKQAAEAKEYKQLVDELRNLEKKVLLKKWKKTAVLLEKYQQELTSYYDQLAACEGELSKEELNGEKQQQNLLYLEQAIQEKQREKEDLINQQSSLERRLDVGKEKLRSWTERLDRLAKDINLLTDQLNVFTENEKESENKYLVLQQEVEELRKELAEKNETNLRLKLVLEELEQKMKEAKEQLIDLLNETAKNNNQLHRIILEQSQIDKTLAKYQEQREAVVEYKDKYEARLTSLKEELLGVEDQQKQTLGRLSEYKADFVEQEKKLAHLNNQRLKIKEKIQDLSTRLRMLQDLEKQKSGYNQGVKAIIKEKEEKGYFPDVYGIVADLIKVSPGYELAIEVALGAGLQYFITKNEKSAREAVSFLKQGRLGRVTFLPLDLLTESQPISLTELKEKHSGLIGSALDVISFARDYDKAVKFLLSKVLIVKDLNTAVKLSREIPKNGRIVTLDGDLVSASGMITGGSWQKDRKNGLLERKREIAEIRKQLTELSVQLRENELELNKRQEIIAGIKSKIELAEEQLVQSRIKTDTLMQEIKHNISLVKENEEKIELFNLEIQELLEQDKELRLEKERIEEKIKVKEELAAKARSNYEFLKSRQENDFNKYLELDKTNTELKVKLAALEERMANFEKVWKQAKQVRLDSKQKLQEQQAEYAELTKNKEALILELADMDEKLKNIIDDSLKLEQILKEKQERRNEQLVVWQATEQKLKALRKKQAELKKKINEQEISLAAYQTEIKHLNQVLGENYGVTRPQELISADPDLIVVKQDTVVRIENLKQKIEQMNSVNLGAIEEFKRVKERYDFLNKQKEDLLEAKKGLIRVVKEMGKKMEKNFLETISKVKANFSLIYGQLFEGGRAELVLTDEDNPLEAGIEIIAQPPGKKQQHLSLLSGGERALTAIALLFAILRVKKSPFSILDEIDASLDEANVRRFADFLKKHAPSGQYIIITHQKATMSAADALYGVTMEEAGVSKIISVKFDEEGREAV